MANQSFKNLTVYKKAFELAMMIFNRAMEVGRLINHMIENPEKYLRTQEKVEH